MHHQTYGISVLVSHISFCWETRGGIVKCFLILVKNRLCVIEFGCPDINFVQSFTHLDKKIKSELQILIAVRVGYFWHL